MTRARWFALAVLFGACCCGPSSTFAQYGGPGAYPGPENCPPGVSPYGTPAPLAGVDPGDTWRIPDDSSSPYAPYGPEQKFDGGFLRTEYLNWNLSDPGNVPLGAPLAGISDPTQPFPVFAPGSNNIISVARVADTFPISLSDNSGIRVTGGLELVNGGSIEVGAFMLARKSSGYDSKGFENVLVSNPGDPFSLHFVPTAIATSTLTNGQVGNDVLLYNREFGVRYYSQLWGAEANWVGDYDREGLIWLNPTVGVRYFSLHEKMSQRGVFQDQVIQLPPVVTTIDSVTFNNLYGPQIGTRMEIVSKWINLGVDPKLMFLANTMAGSVTTNHLRSNNDGVFYSSDTTTSLSFGVDIGVNAQVNLSHNFSIRVGYNFIWLNRVTRPEDNIYYNNNGDSAPPGIVERLEKHDFVVHGVSVGGELRF